MIAGEATIDSRGSGAASAQLCFADRVLVHREFLPLLRIIRSNPPLPAQQCNRCRLLVLQYDE